MRNRIAAAVFGLALALPSLSFASTWEIDGTHSSVTFSIRHLAISNVRGEFTKVSGAVALDEKNLKESTVEATIDASSITTNNEKRDGHLKSPDFFDVQKFPTITFKSTSIAKAGGAGKFKVTGDLTMHGVTKSVVLSTVVSAPVKDPMGPGERRGAHATTTVSREDFGISWNKVVLGKEVEIEIDAELVNKGTGATSAAPKAATGTQTGGAGSAGTDAKGK